MLFYYFLHQEEMQWVYRTNSFDSKCLIIIYLYIIPQGLGYKFELKKKKKARQEHYAEACLLQQLKTAREETPRELHALILKMLGKSKLIKTLKDLISSHKGYTSYQVMLTLNQIAS